MNTENLYCIVRRDHRIAPEADRFSFATAHAEGAGFEWGGAADAERYSARDIARVLDEIEDYRTGTSSRYVRNGCASPDDLYIVHAEVADEADARALDPTRYPIPESELDAMGDDLDAFERRCSECDLELLEDSALDWADILAAEFGEGSAVDADERRKLEEADYSASDAAGALVLARNDRGSILYRIPGNFDYAVEGGSGAIYAELSALDAFREWFA